MSDEDWSIPFNQVEFRGFWGDGNRAERTLLDAINELAIHTWTSHMEGDIEE